MTQPYRRIERYDIDGAEVRPDLEDAPSSQEGIVVLDGAAAVELEDAWILTEDHQADWYQAALHAPERVAAPEPPKVGARLSPPIADGSWPRVRINAAEVEQARAEGIAVCKHWSECDLRSGLYNKLGVVVLDGVDFGYPVLS